MGIKLQWLPMGSVIIRKCVKRPDLRGYYVKYSMYVFGYFVIQNTIRTTLTGIKSEQVSIPVGCVPLVC